MNVLDLTVQYFQDSPAEGPSRREAHFVRRQGFAVANADFLAACAAVSG
ncbi:MAG: hypothetical protein HOH74_08715 [Gemmatimonadetes bacterium]|jgi:hypothetical protein|nr:hypothetical protein [Gemmatimonadota bacterium]